jgi:hypothetical protein
MLLRRVLNCFLLLCAFAWLATASAFASEYHGQVTFNGLPVPGTAVTATQGDKKLSAVTDDQGIYEFADLPDGKWTIDIAMTGFAPVTEEVTIPPGGPVAAIEIKLLTLDQLRAATKPVKVDQAPDLTAAVPATPAPGATTSGTTPAAAANGKKPAAPTQQASGGAPEPPPPPAPSDPQASDGLLINGSVNNAATSQYAMSQAFGNNRTNGRSLYNYGLMATLDNSALDANSYSLAGIPTPKQSYDNFTLGVQFGGPIRIPNHWNPRNFRVDFANYQRIQKSTTATQTALVPTLAQRYGDLSGIATPVYDPATGKPYGNTGCSSQLLAVDASPTACIPGTELATKNSQAAQALLTFYPLPNATGGTRNNYQVQTATNVRQDGAQFRLSKPFGNKDYVYGNFSLQSIRQGTNTLFGFHDTTNQFNLAFGANWNHRFTQRLFVNTGYTFSRSRQLGTPYFANRVNVEGQTGIAGVDTSPVNWGPPSLGFTSGFQSLSDANSSRYRSETNGVSIDVQWNRSRHIIDAGGDFRRQEFNYFSQTIPRGAFQFTGAATNGGVTTAGSDLADFLLGIPDTSQLSYGNPDKYLRQSVYDLFAQDDFRVNPELSIKYGVRWEYGAPITETQNRLVNLDFASGFTAEAPVLAKSPTGPLSGMSYPTSLVRPDKIGFAPNVGIAWRPISGSSLLIRSGYQISHETSVYQATALLMATQAPLAISPNLNNAVCPLTLTAAFPTCPSITADNFALDPNFRVGYVQTWNVSAQRDLPGSLQAIVTYTGIKGTRGVQEFAPNTYAYGGANPCPSCPVGFLYRTSNGNSTREAARGELRRRLRNGFTADLVYTFSKSLDDDYVFGASQTSTASPQVAQDWRHPNAQRGLSTFDQRHVLSLQMQYTTGMGLGGHTLLSGWRGVVYKEWSFIATVSAASGTPETPTYAATVPGTAFSNIFRPDYTGKSLSSSSPGFNPLAFTVPAAGSFGNARRDSIPGPDQFGLSATMRRDFRLHDRYTLGAEIDANNVLNHVVYTSWYNSISPSNPNPLFGTPSNTNSMRSITITLRLRN